MMELHFLVRTFFDLTQQSLKEISYFFEKKKKDSKHRWVNAENMLKKTLVGILVYE
jgi:hypothetical protein